MDFKYFSKQRVTRENHGLYLEFVQSLKRCLNAFAPSQPYTPALNYAFNYQPILNIKAYPF
jgi:hypothetical protein